MHTFISTDSQILLGLYFADRGTDISCMDLVTSCAVVNSQIPALEEFTSAFNKFLYVGAINLNGNKITFARFGREIINKAKINADVDANSSELIQFVLKELSGYKLKSTCNRSVWTQEQYQQAINVHRNNPSN